MTNQYHQQEEVDLGRAHIEEAVECIRKVGTWDEVDPALRGKHLSLQEWNGLEEMERGERIGRWQG